MRESNQRLIIDFIRKKPLSRADLSRAMGLSRAAVTILTNSLIEQGIIINGKAIKSESGRRPTLLHLNSDAYISIGIDLCREGCEILLTDFSGNEILRKKTDFLENAEKTVSLICEEITLALSIVNRDSTVLGLCICAPGPIDYERGMILNPSGFSLFHNYDIKAAFASHFNFPVYLEKDTNVLAIAENKREDIQGDLMFLLADHGIGCSSIKDGCLFLGRDGIGGELGHTTININGPQCVCGNVGCAEMYASIPATLKNANETSWETLISKAKCGNQIAINALRTQGKILAALCVNAVNLFEPHNIILGGKLIEADFILKDMIQNALDESAFLRNTIKAKVYSSHLGKNSRSFAAAITALEYYFRGGMHL
jgi:predicted NBD/HSP70 family sugar kinase